MFNQEALLVRAYNMRTGELEWEDAYPGSIGLCLCHALDVAVQNHRVYVVGGGRGTSQSTSIIRAYDAGSGDLLWQREMPIDGNTGRGYTSVAVDRRIVFASEAGVLRAFDGK